MGIRERVGKNSGTFQAVGQGWEQIAKHHVHLRERRVPAARQTAFVVVIND
jgi:hypothetical protein